MSEFTHFDSAGNAWMVDVSEKTETERIAVAVGSIFMNQECFEKIKDKTVKKGDVLTIAQVAGIMGAKKTSELIPLCHPLSLTKLSIDFELKTNEIVVKCIAKTHGVTGVEMEALTGVQIALLTIYDMCKAIDRSMHIENVHLVSKTGGKSGDFEYEGPV